MPRPLPTVRERSVTSPHQVPIGLPDIDLTALTPHLKRIELTRGAVLAEAGDVIETVYFPTQGMISLVVGLANGQMIEAGMVGRAGILGGSCLVGGARALARWVVQVAGTAFTIAAERFGAIAAGQPGLVLAAGRHEQYLLAQAQQACACSAAHTVDARLAAWLLRCSDLLAGADISLTQEHLAEMLGLQRTTVSIAAAALQRGGAIHYRRGHIQITDPAGLRCAACECYEALALQRRRIFGPDAGSE